MATEERWRERFGEFEATFARLRTALAIPEDEMSGLDIEDIFQCFHYTLDLAWRVLTDALEREGVMLDRATLGYTVLKAFEAKLLDDCDIWFDMIKDRDCIVHQSGETRLEAVVDNVRARYFAAFEALHARFAGDMVDA